MKYLALFAFVAMACATELRPVVLPAPVAPYVEAAQEAVRVVEAPFEAVRVVDAPEQPKATIPVPEDLMKKVLEATTYVFKHPEAVKVAELPESVVVERVQVVDAPIEVANAEVFDRVQVVDAPVNVEAPVRVQLPEAPVERVQVVDAPVMEEVLEDKVRVVDMPIHGRQPGKVYPNPYWRGGKH